MRSSSSWKRGTGFEARSSRSTMVRQIVSRISVLVGRSVSR
jgi:hypothetical protein